MSISFEGRVAIVTGAGGGLGRAYALELAKRGAKVVVNDLGGARDGTGHSDAALQVVAEIEAAGGEAMSNGASVTEFEQMQEMAAKAKEKWGGVHILINNAGVLRDKSFAKMEIEDFDFVVKVHLTGSAYATKAVWETMREQGHGRRHQQLAPIDPAPDPDWQPALTTAEYLIIDCDELRQIIARKVRKDGGHRLTRAAVAGQRVDRDLRVAQQQAHQFRASVAGCAKNPDRRRLAGTFARAFGLLCLCHGRPPSRRVAYRKCAGGGRRNNAALPSAGGRLRFTPPRQAEATGRHER